MNLSSRRRTRSSRPARSPGPVFEPLEVRRLFAVTTLTNGAGDGSISVIVDAYGQYGSASGNAGDLTYDPIGSSPAQESTYNSGVLFSPAGGYLGEAGLGSLPAVNFDSASPTVAVSQFDVSNYHIVLTQTLGPRTGETTTLTQTYAIRNDTGSVQSFNMTRHVDGDMSFVGTLSNDFAGVSLDGRFVFEFDTASDPTASTAYFGISATGDGTAGGWSIQGFPFYDDIDLANQIPDTARNQNYRDTNGDRLTDTGDDVTISLQDNFTVAAGQTVTYTTITTFGTGSPLDLVSPGIFSVGQTAYTVDEAAGTMTVTVDRTSGSAGDVRVNYAVAGQTATAGADFGASAGTLTFLNGVRSQQFVVPITEDTTVDPDERFTITLSAPTGGSQLSPTATTARVTIDDNDATLQSAASTFSVREDGGVATVVVSRLGDTGNAATVDYVTADGTAQAGVDYAATSGTVSFAPGETSKTILVPVFTDTLSSEPTETFTVTLSNVSGVNHLPGSPSTATVDLVNFDTAPPTATVAFTNGSKGITALVLTFSEPLDGTAARDSHGYTIWSRGTDGRNGTGPDKTLRIKSVVYDAATNTATVAPAKPLPFNRVYQLSLNSRFITDVSGNRLDGNADGAGGDSANFFFGRGNRLSYVDRDGDKVSLRVKNGGALEFLRAFDGEAQEVALVDDTGASEVSGLVKQTRMSAGTTTLRFVGRLTANRFNTTQFIVS